MNVLYLVHSGINVSETFILNLVNGLGQRCSNLRVVSGAKTGTYIPKSKVVYSSYYSRNIDVASAIFQVSKLLGHPCGYRFKNAYLKRRITSSLKRHLDWADVVYIDYLITAVYICDYLNIRSKPFVVHLHGYDVTGSLNDPVYKERAIIALSSAHKVMAASNHMKRLAILFAGLDISVNVVRYGLNSSDFIVPERAEKTDCPSVISLGRLIDKKHPIALLHAFKLVLNKIPSARLEIIGDGSLRNLVLQRIKVLDMAHAVRLFGALPNEEAKKRLRSAWVFAQHSVTASNGDQEGFAISPAEAALYEIPVVSTIHNGITEHVIDGETGYLVQEFDYESMAEKILLLLHDDKLRERLGQKGRLNIKQLCDEEKRVESVHSILKDAFQKKSH